MLYIKHDQHDSHDWNFKVLYEIKEEGILPEFQGEDYQIGKYGNPIEFEENEFDDLEDAYRYAIGVVMSEEVVPNTTLNQLLER